MSSPFTKEEVEWWTEQAEKLKSFWYLFENIPCDAVVKIVDEAMRRTRRVACEQVESNRWYIWECANKYLLVFNGLEWAFKLRLIDTPQYADTLRRTGYLGVGVDEYREGAECALRVLQIRGIYLPFLDISFNGINKIYGYYYIRIILDENNVAYLGVTPHREVDLLLTGTLRIGRALALEDIKRITERDDIRRYTEETIDRAVELFSELRLPAVTYILY